MTDANNLIPFKRPPPPRNRVRCKKCKDVIESLSVHDFVRCKCGACFVDGGTDYKRRGWEGSDNPDDIFEELP